MIRPYIQLTPKDIYFAVGNHPDQISVQIQHHWIAEAIQYAYPELISQVFQNHPEIWPQFPVVDQLAAHKTEHYGLRPILANEGTIDGTYDVIRTIFEKQFGVDSSHTSFNNKLQLVYGDQKTIGLIQSVQRESTKNTHPYDQFRWIVPVPGLFHWHMNFIDMIYDIHIGDEDNLTCPSTLTQNANALGCVQGIKTPFHYKEQLALRAFDGRVTAFFHEENPNIKPDTRAFNRCIKQSGPVHFLKQIDNICQKMFNPGANFINMNAKHELSTHSKFLQQMEIYKTLKQAIKIADIGLIHRVIARCCLLFNGASKSNYTKLSLYMT